MRFRCSVYDAQGILHDEPPDRYQRFRLGAALRKRATDAELRIVSVDIKKKEFLGHFPDSGKCNRRTSELV